MSNSNVTFCKILVSCRGTARGASLLWHDSVQFQGQFLTSVGWLGPKNSGTTMLWNFGNYSISASHTNSLLVVKIYTDNLHELSTWKTGDKSVPCTFKYCVHQENQHIFLYVHKWQINSNSVVVDSHVLVSNFMCCSIFSWIYLTVWARPHLVREAKWVMVEQNERSNYKNPFCSEIYTVSIQTTMSCLNAETLYLCAKIWNPCLLYKVFEWFPKTMFKHNT